MCWKDWAAGWLRRCGNFSFPFIISCQLFYSACSLIEQREGNSINLGVLSKPKVCRFLSLETMHFFVFRPKLVEDWIWCHLEIQYHAKRNRLSQLIICLLYVNISFVQTVGFLQILRTTQNYVKVYMLMQYYSKLHKTMKLYLKIGKSMQTYAKVPKGVQMYSDICNWAKIPLPVIKQTM